MLRVVTRKSVKRGLNNMRHQSTEVSKHSQIIPKWSGAKKLALSMGIMTAGAGGFTGYAYYYPEFRKKIESELPQIKVVFDTIFGETSSQHAKQNVTEIKEEVTNIPSKKEVEKVLPPITFNPPLVSEKKETVHVDPVDIKDVLDINVKPTSHAAQNKQLEASLLAAIQSAESRVHIATDAKIQTINAIDQHAQLMKQTVDDMQHADWGKVTSALQTAQSLASNDSSAETDSRNYIDNLRKVISLGKSNPSTANNPLLLNAIETANKLSYQLDELNSLVTKARQDSIVLNNYKNLIERSREQFAIEMKNILPNVDIHAKEKNLTEEELNALIAHAHLKVDQLRRQLTEQQVREEQHIAQAIEDQKRADNRVADNRLNIEVMRLKQQQEVDIEKALILNRSSWEVEMEEQLQRTAAAHSEHLEKVIRTQRQLFEIEQQQKVEDAVAIERDNHSRQIGVALSRLEGIETALNSRVAMDAENRRAKQFWIACHNLIDNIKHGNKGGLDMEQRRFPLNECLGLLQEANSEDSFINNLLAAFPVQSKEKGVYTEQDLKNRFYTIYKLGRRTASIDDNGGGILSYMWSYVRSVFLFDIPRTFSYDDKIDPYAISNLEVLSRARWFMERGDMEGAVRIFQLLRGEPARLACDWIIDTRTHLESRLLAQLLVAHAAVSSITSTY